MTFCRTLLAAAAFLTLGSAAQAANQVINLSSGQASFVATAPILAGGDDVLTFTGLAPGLYDFVFSVSSQFVTGFNGTVNGTPFALASLGPIVVGAVGRRQHRAVQGGPLRHTKQPVRHVFGRVDRNAGSRTRHLGDVRRRSGRARHLGGTPADLIRRGQRPRPSSRMASTFRAVLGAGRSRDAPIPGHEPTVDVVLERPHPAALG